MSVDDKVDFIRRCTGEGTTAGKENTGKCPLCGGGLHDGSSAIPFFLGDKIVVVKDVPAEVCADCGEAYMKSGVAKNVEKLLDALESLHAEMSVVHYKVA